HGDVEARLGMGTRSALAWRNSIGALSGRVVWARARVSMLSLMSIPQTSPSGPTGRDLGRQQPGTGADVDDALAWTQPHPPQHRVALLDDIRGCVGRLDPARGLSVELQHAGHLPPPVVG